LPRQRSLAGLWYGYVSLPIFQFMPLRWYFRLFIWARWLWQVSRLELSLVPTHPDRAGGLGFLSYIVYAFMPLLLAQRTLYAGMIANRIFFLGAKLPAFTSDLALWVAVLVFAVLGPVLVFSPQLVRAKWTGLREYGVLAQRYVREFDHKWLRGGAAADEPLVGSGDIQSHADLGNSFEVIRTMRLVPFTTETLLLPTFESHVKAPTVLPSERAAPSALLLTSWSQLDAGPEDQEESMKAPVPPTPEIVEVKRWDHLPLVGALLRELAVKATLDALIPAHDRHVVTVGECVAALVLTILTGEHAVSRVADPLAGSDLAVIAQRPMDAASFHDNRLGGALDALWTVGVARVCGAVITQAIRPYASALTPRHTDATSLKVYGAYPRDEHEEGPVVTYGYSRDHRPDLKQRLFGLTVTAEGVPVWGHSTDGNQSASTEHRFHITPLRRHRPELGEPLWVADSKFFAGDTIALAAAHRLRFGTLLPQTVGLRQEWVDDPTRRELPLLWERPGRRQGAWEASHGASGVRP
jgi:hypothetical protein